MAFDSTCYFLFFISWSGFESQTLACSESQLRKRPVVTEALFQNSKPPSAGSGLAFLKLETYNLIFVSFFLASSVVLTLLSKPFKIYKRLIALRNQGVQPKMPFRRSLILSAGRKWSTTGPRWLTRGY